MGIYYVKGCAASVSGLIQKWLGVHLAQDFGLTVPPFEIGGLDNAIIDCFGSLVITELKGCFGFVSRQVSSDTELRL